MQQSWALHLGGAFKHVWFSPQTLGKWSNLTCAYFSNGWRNNHQLVHVFVGAVLACFFLSSQCRGKPALILMDHWNFWSHMCLQRSDLKNRVIWGGSFWWFLPTWSLTINPWKYTASKWKVVFQPSYFRGELLKFGVVIMCSNYLRWWLSKSCDWRFLVSG